jgi:hypothetical protein
VRLSKINLFAFFILVVTFNNCRDKYEFKKLNLESNLVVDGRIHDGPGPYYLNLGTTNFPDRPANPLTNAIITITDDRGLKELYEEVGNGRYQLKGTIVNGRPGIGYAIDIRLPNGKVYHSTTEIMPEVPQATDSTYWEVSNEKVVSSEGVVINNVLVNVYLNSQLQISTIPGYFRWGLDEVYSIFPSCLPGKIECPHICYVFKPTSTYNIVLVKTTDYPSHSTLSNILLQSQGVDYSFAFEHFFNVTQYSMNQSSYQYWTKVQELTMKKGSIFDTPPAIITGNISNESDGNEIVYGYFEATGQKISRTKVARGNIPFHQVDCQIYPERTYYRFCESCTYLPGSTAPQPSWWF